MAQRDPLVEYQREGYDMFQAMLDGMKEESVGFLFNVQVEAAPLATKVAPVAAPEGLAEFAGRQPAPLHLRPAERGPPRLACAPRESTTNKRARPDLWWARRRMVRRQCSGTAASRPGRAVHGWRHAPRASGSLEAGQDPQALALPASDGRDRRAHLNRPRCAIIAGPTCSSPAGADLSFRRRAAL